MIDYLVGISYGDFDDKITASSQYNDNHSIKGCKLNKTMMYICTSISKESINYIYI